MGTFLSFSFLMKFNGYFRRKETSSPCKLWPAQKEDVDGSYKQHFWIIEKIWASNCIWINNWRNDMHINYIIAFFLFVKDWYNKQVYTVKNLGGLTRKEKTYKFYNNKSRLNRR